MDNFIIVQEHPMMIQYIDALQKKNAEALSFYPKSVFEREKEKKRLFLGLLNNEPCGYLYVGATGGDLKCHQVCIQYDARRRLYGAAIVGAMENYAWDGLCSSVTLRCGFDLDANDFWKAMGYRVIKHDVGGVRRMRTINVWRKIITEDIFSTSVIDAAKGTTDATIWRKNKDSGVVTQFVRGDKMKEYRATLIEKHNNEFSSWLLPNENSL